jgi:tRNA (guanine-N7-)-methyltransferase
MARKLKYDIPGPDWRCTPEQLAEQGCEAIFAPELAPPLRIVVEIGFGRGEFIADLAARDPEGAYLGIEVSFKRVLKMARRIAASPLRNLRLVHARGQEFLRDCLMPDSVATFWINFPDPWPKKRHAKHRIVQPAFVHLLATRLRPGGTLHLATDDRAYAEQMDEVLSAEPLLENANAPLHWVPEVPGRMHTGYEEDWRAEGRPMHFFEYRRRADAPEAGSETS